MPASVQASAGDPGEPNKAKIFFQRGRTVAATGNFEYAIEMFIQGLGFDPDNVRGHSELREISLQRKERGGRDIGMFDKMKLPKSLSPEQAMLNAEKMLAFDPGNIDRMAAMLRAATAGGFEATAKWVAHVLRDATSS